MPAEELAVVLRACRQIDCRFQQASENGVKFHSRAKTVSFAGVADASPPCAQVRRCRDSTMVRTPALSAHVHCWCRSFIVFKIIIKWGALRIDISATPTILAIAMLPLVPELLAIVQRLIR